MGSRLEERASFPLSSHLLYRDFPRPDFIAVDDLATRIRFFTRLAGNTNRKPLFSHLGHGNLNGVVLLDLLGIRNTNGIAFGGHLGIRDFDFCFLERSVFLFHLLGFFPHFGNRNLPSFDFGSRPGDGNQLGFRLLGHARKRNHASLDLGSILNVFSIGTSFRSSFQFCHLVFQYRSISQTKWSHFGRRVCSRRFCSRRVYSRRVQPQ